MENIRKQHNSELNPQQRTAATAPQGPLLIVAGAGTGKTRTLTSRLIYFIEQGIRPEKICAITFTNKAAKEMAGRIYNANDANPMRMPRKNGPDSQHSHTFADSHCGTPFIGTFHALGARILRKECRHFGRKPNFVIFDDHDSFTLIKKIAKGLVPQKKTENKNKKWEGTWRTAHDEANYERPTCFARKISEIKNTDSALKDLVKSAKEKDKLTLRAFRLYEKRLGENNAFDFDDLIEKVVRLFTARPEIAEKYQKKFDAVLVDEYQDLNPMQYEFVKLLAGKHRSLSVVGDDEQLIYGWRYADLKTFLNFERDWPGARIVFLEENYRSTANIISAASAVAANNVYRRPKDLWTKNEAGALIKIHEAVDENGEAEWVASEIEKLKMKNEKLSSAVLYRTNAQSRALEEALIKNQIPYQIFGGVKFYERKEIRDIVAALRLAANADDEISRDRLEKNLSKRKFSDLTENIAARQSQNKCGEKKKAASPTELINIFLKTVDYIEYLERNFMNYDERRENIGELINFASRYDNLQQFLEEIALVQQTDMPSAGTTTTHSQPVHLSTIHLAKGLEFDNVFIAGAAEGLLPHARAMDDGYQLEEERRLMYVAMTRAKKNLHVSFFDVPSRFISEIPGDLIEPENKSGGDFPPDDNSENFISYD